MSVRRSARRSARRARRKSTANDAAIARLLQLPADARLLARWGGPGSDPAATLTQLYDAINAHTRVHPGQALQAVDHVQRALAAAVATNADRARWLRLRAHALRATGHAEQAAEHYARAFAAFAKLRLREELGPTSIGWVDALALAGRPREASRVAARGRRALAARDTLGHARLTANLGNAHYWAGRLDEAIAHYRAAYRRFVTAKRPADAALCAFNWGNALLLQGKAGAARPLLVEAERALAKAGARVLELQAQYGLASLDLVQGRWEEGTQALARLQHELEQRGDERTAAAVRRELAGLLTALGALEIAEPVSAAAYAAYHKLGLRGEAAHAAFLHARLLILLDRHHDAQVRLEQARAHWRATDNRWAAALTDLETARAWLARGKPGRALRVLQPARAVLQRRDRRGGGARATALAAEAMLAQKQPGQAAALAARALRDARLYPAVAERPWMALTLARALLAQKKGAEAVRQARRAVRELEALLARFGSRAMRASVAGSRERLYRGCVDVVLRHGGPRAARVALDLIATARSAELIEDLLRRDGRLLRGELRVAIARLRDELLSAKDPGTGDVRSRALRGQLHQLERQLAGGPRVPAGVARQAIQARTVASWAPKLGARSLVLYDRTQDGWRAFVVRGANADGGAGRSRGERVECRALPDGERALREAWLPLRMLLEAAAQVERSRRQQLLARTHQEADAALERLREAFWTPLSLAPGSDPVGDAVLVPTGALHGVPLEALPHLNGGAVVSRLPHPAVLRDDPALRRRVALLLHGLEAGTRGEVQAVRATLDAAGYGTTVGDRRTDLDRWSGARPADAPPGPLGVLHVAAHGAFHREQALLSGIRLADGWIGFEQLDPHVIDGALVYFGSCESGLTREGPGAELDGWLAAGIGAGAREMILTLWKLDDEAAIEFARAFYPRWAAGMSAPQAAALARQQVRTTLPHPFSWAPFVALG